MASASLTGRGAAAGATAGGAGVCVPWSYWRENLVSPPRLRIWACSIQFSRPMRPSIPSSFSKRSTSAGDQWAICE